MVLAAALAMLRNVNHFLKMPAALISSHQWDVHVLKGQKTNQNDWELIRKSLWSCFCALNSSQTTVIVFYIFYANDTCVRWGYCAFKPRLMVWDIHISFFPTCCTNFVLVLTLSHLLLLAAISHWNMCHVSWQEYDVSKVACWKWG